MVLPLEGLLVVSLEQAVAAPLCSVKLADAGARVIKIERPEGDFARGYDDVVHGESANFVWLNRGKESVCLDLEQPADKRLLEALIAAADVFVQNLKPGAIARLGFDRDRLRARYPRLILCSIAGYSEKGPYAARKAYDLLIQAEAGLASITGGPEAPARVGVSVVDIGTGLAAYEAILEALIARGRMGAGADIRLSMFDAIADWCTVPLLQFEGGKPPQRLGLAHPSIAPYGVFRSADDVQLLIAVQSDREWQVLAERVLRRPDIAMDERLATNIGRCAHRARTDGLIADAFAALTTAELVERLSAASIAFARVGDMATLAVHPELTRLKVDTPTGPVAYPAPAHRRRDQAYGPVPALGAHTAAVRAEFAGGVTWPAGGSNER